MEFDIFLFMKFVKYTLLIILGVLSVFYFAAFLEDLTRKGLKYARITLIKLTSLFIVTAILFANLIIRNYYGYY